MVGAQVLQKSILKKIHHFNNFHHSINTEVIEECSQVLLHLDAVVVHLGHSEDAHLALPPNLRSKNTVSEISQNLRKCKLNSCKTLSAGIQAVLGWFHCLY